MFTTSELFLYLVNLIYFLMEPSRKSHANKLSLFLWHNAIYDATESVG